MNDPTPETEPNSEPVSIESAGIEQAPVDPSAPAQDLMSQVDRAELPSTEQPVKTAGRAGRDLGAALGISLLLGVVIVGSLLLYRPAFAIIVGLAVIISIWEMARAVEGTGVQVSLAPMFLGGLSMVAMAWFRGVDGLAIAALLTIFAVIIWRLADGASGYLTSAATSVFIAVYIPFLAGFAVLLAVPDDGTKRILAFMIAVVCSDTGGYAAGVMFGKHPMAPTISPKKSWEGFAGSVVTAAVFGVLMLTLAFDGQWWQGLIFGVAMAVTATLGDLGES
ncbi:MAG: phosphatidate cytidylyltransferase, partial [Antricoccus sp.]